MQAIESARAASARFGHPFVSSAHLVLGLLMFDSGAARALKTTGLTPEAAEQYLMAHPLRMQQTQEKDGALLGTSAVLAIDGAEKERQSGPPRFRFVGTDHLLLALCREEAGDAFDLFQALNIDRGRTRQLVLERLAEPWSPDFEKIIDDTERLLNEIENRKD